MHIHSSFLCTLRRAACGALTLGLLAGPVHATGSRAEDIYSLALKNDRAAIVKALSEAVAQDRASGTEPDLQRGLFNAFALTDPRVDSFTKDWLAAEPASAYALTARGWHLYALGWTMRGERPAHRTLPDAIEAMSEHHAAAFELFERASTIDPDLIAASDGVLRLTQTLGHVDIIPIELERIMSRAPNRGSLMRAMGALAPQWGGRWEQVDLLCNRYAPRITTLQNYDSDTCRIDAVYFANFWQGNRREAAQQLLALNDHPILEYARMTEVLDGNGPAAYRKRKLEKIKAERPLGDREAWALDAANSEVSNAAFIEATPEYDAAIAATLDEVRLWADRNPFVGNTVLTYLGHAAEVGDKGGPVFDRDDAIARLKRLLKAVPYDDRAWLLLGNILAGPDYFPSLAAIEAADGAFTNAVAYSYHDYQTVLAKFDLRLRALIDPQNFLAVRSFEGMSPDDQARFDRVVNCPFVLEVQRVSASCAQNDIPLDSCADGAFKEDSAIITHVQSLWARNMCKAEFEAPYESLVLSPVAFDFQIKH